MEILFKIYEGLEREGPGSRAMTGRALAAIKGNRREISLYRAHPGVYGYEFFCFRKRSA